MLEQIWARPTAEVNGIVGGYTGEGAKTVIPAKASAKVSFRLVGDQDPEAIRTGFRAFVEARLPADCKVTFLTHGGDRAISQPSDSPWVQKAERALSEEWGSAGGAHRDGRLDPDRHAVQAHPRDGLGA